MPENRPVRTLLFVTPFLDDNSTGRTYSLWLLARALGWRTRVISFHGSGVWSPLKGTEFEENCELFPDLSRRKQVEVISRLSADADVVVAVKPLRQSFGLVLSSHRKQGFPFVIDIDDPDLEARLSFKPLWRALAWRARYFSYWLTVRDPKSFAKRGTVLVSNPALHTTYGGHLLPHARDSGVNIVPHTSHEPVTAFVGTPRTHKGIDVLRAAVSLVHERGHRLIITGDAPPDAKPWESWVGNVSFEEGLKLVANADVVAIPSKQDKGSVGQLPVKLVDAMMLGRAVIVTDIDPLPWAVSGKGIVVPENDIKAVAEALKRLEDPTVRGQLGAEMRRRGESTFSVDALKSSFARACYDAVENVRSQTRRP